MTNTPAMQAAREIISRIRSLGALNIHDGISERAFVAIIERHMEPMREALQNLVRACTPSVLPADEERIHGVRMPEKEIVEAARAALAAEPREKKV